MSEVVTDDRRERYLALRSSFLDRFVANATEAGVGQFVVVGGGYSGGSTFGPTRWWQVPSGPAMDKALVEDGFQVESPTRFILAKGAKLAEEELLHLLRSARSLASPGTRLAICWRPPATAPAPDMAAPQQLSVLLEKTRWRAVKISEKSQRAGFVVALPAWVPAGDGPAATNSALGCFCEWVFHRDATASLGEHLSGAYGVAVERAEELDVGTFKVQIKSGSPWVARVFPSTRPEADVQREVDVMHHLDAVGFPVEKFPVARPVSVLEGQPVVVTEFVHGSEMKSGAANFGRIGRLLGELHTVQVDEGWQRHPGGAWHHLALDTSPAGELMVLRSLLSPARHRVTVGEENLYDKLVAAVEAADACADLPHALGHPDLVPRNMIVRPGKSPTVIDWAGVGWYPRVMSLGSTLWAARDARSVSSAVGAYREKVTLSAVEMDRLATAVAHRPLVLACWSFITGREDLAWVAKFWENQLARSLKIADQARVAWSGGDR